MRKLFLFLILLTGSFAATGQVIPSNFPVETAPDTSNFEVYSQKGASLKRTNFYYMRPYFDQDLSLSGDTLYISKRDADGFVVLSPYSQTLSLDGDTLSVSGGNSVVLSTGGTDDQTLSVSNDTLTIESGNSIVLPRYVNSDGATIGGDSENTAIYLLDNAVTTTKIAAGAVGTTDIADDAVTLAKMENMDAGELVGRSTSGTGNPEHIAVGSGLTLSGGVLSVSAGSTGLTYAALTVGSLTARVWYSGSSAPTVTGSAGVYTITVPSGTQLSSFRIYGDSGILSGGGDLSITVDWDGVSWNTSESNAMYPAITLIENASASNVQVSNQGTGYQITHPTVAAGATTTVITGISGLSSFTVVGNIQ